MIMIGVFGAAAMIAIAGVVNAEKAPASNTGSFEHIPATVSKEAAAFLKTYVDPATLPDWPAGDDVEGWQRAWEEREKAYEPSVVEALKRYESKVVERKLGGVAVLDVTPRGWKESRRWLIYVHGGAHTLGSARSTLPIAAMAADACQMRVISIDYTVAPQAKWQQQNDQVLAVFDALRKDGHAMRDLAIFGDSAGGALAAGAVLRMRDQGLEMPAAIVLWAPWADVTNSGDTAVTLKHADPAYLYDKHLKHAADAYADAKDHKHPYVSPVYGDFTKGFPPALIQVGTKEIFLSHAVRMYRNIDDAGGVAMLDVYEGMPHIFQPAIPDAPETKTVLRKMAAFLRQNLEDE
jgi:acetyl esterase/lipase